MNNGNDRLEVLSLMNNDLSLNLYNSNIHLKDFNYFNLSVNCKYYTEEAFTQSTC